jgi:hypothetical protein
MRFSLVTLSFSLLVIALAACQDGEAVTGQGEVSVACTTDADCAAGKACVGGECGAGAVVTRPAGVKVTDGPLAPGAACDPIGKWILTWGTPTEKSGAWCTEPQAANINVAADATGALFISYENLGNFSSNSSARVSQSGSLSEDGCQLILGSGLFETGGSEFWTVSVTTSLTLAGDTATGTYSASNGDFCNGSKAGPATAVRE